MNEIIISNIPPQNINIGEGGVTGITRVYVNGVDVTEGSNAYVIVPTKLSELINDKHFITSESDPTVPTWVKAISISDINNWNNKVSPSDLDNYVKFTDYATDTKGGVVKIDNQNGIYINSSNGKIYAAALTFGSYELSNNRIFISKYTLESVISGKNLETANNKVTSISSDSTNIQYPSAKCVYDSQTLQDNEISDLKSENDYLNSIINQLPKVSSQGTILTLNNTINGRMNIELGTSELEQGADPSPTNPQTIHTISGNNKVVVEGKNRFNISNAQYQSNSTPKVQDGKLVANSPTAWSSAYYTITGLNKNTTYYLKSKLAYTSGGGAYSQIFGGSALDQSKVIKTYMNSVTTSGDYNTSFSTGDNDTITISFCTSNASGIWNISDIILSNEDTTYTPYTSQEANINLGDIEYCEIGDYKDKFVRDNEGNWQLKKNIVKVVLDGTENWGRFNELLYTDSISDYAISNNIPVCIHFKGISNVSSGSDTKTQDNQIAFLNSHQYERLFIYSTNFSTDTEFKAWLSTHNTIVYYVLATPTYTPITGDLAEQLENIYQYLLSYKGQTNISQINNDLPFNISASALLDLNTLVGE